MLDKYLQNRRPELNPGQPLGYARVSTYGRTLDAQLDQLRKAGCTQIHREKATGARPDQRELPKLLKVLALGDVVTVDADRPSRPLDLPPARRRQGNHGQGRAIVVAGRAMGRLLDTGTARPIIAVLGGLADVECTLIRTRTAEGRARAKARGQRMG